METSPHPKTRILDLDGRVGFDRDDFAGEIWLRLDLVWMDDELILYLVANVGEIRHELAKEDFFVGACAGDQAHQLLSVGIACRGRLHGSTQPETMERCAPHKTCTENNFRGDNHNWKECPAADEN